MGKRVYFKDKRLYERNSCSIVGEYVDKDNKSTGIKCVDISATGAGFLVPELPNDFDLHINIFNRRSVPLPLDGIVRWCKKETNGWRLGVLFNKQLTLPLNVILKAIVF